MTNQLWPLCLKSQRQFRGNIGSRSPRGDVSTSRCSGSQSDRLRNRKHSQRARNVVKRIFFFSRGTSEKNHIREKRFRRYRSSLIYGDMPAAGSPIQSLELMWDKCDSLCCSFTFVYFSPAAALSCSSGWLQPPKLGTGKHHGLTSDTWCALHGRRWRSDLLWKQPGNVSRCPNKPQMKTMIR